MAQQLRVLAAIPEALSSIPSTRWLETIYNEIWCPLLAFRNTWRQNVVYIINLKKKKKGLAILLADPTTCLVTGLEISMEQ